jgi:hypothetical protein
MFLHQGELVITLTALGRDDETIIDLALFSVELESEGLREQMSVLFCSGFGSGCLQCA